MDAFAGGLNSAEQAHLQKIVEQKQMKDFMHTYTGLVQRCFTDCVSDFTSKTLTSKEDQCLEKCVTKFLKYSERVGQRFAEQNAALMQSRGA